ncbi:MAG: A24 family peptidase [Acidimicrobiia bacterium]
MWIAALLSAVVGIVAGRSIVAEVSAHRRERPDRLWDPECDVCDGSLSMTLRVCVPQNHRQRAATPLVPIATAVVFGAMAISVPTLWVLPAYLVFAAAMVALTMTDLDTQLIPNRILGPTTALAVGLLVIGGLIAGEPSALLRAGGGGAAYLAVMFVLALLARGGLGFGDVKLAFLIGVFTGYLGWGQVIVAGIGGFLIGGLVAIVLLVTRRSGRKDAIPFGPFMTLAAIIAVVFGEAITQWYLR